MTRRPDSALLCVCGWCRVCRNRNRMRKIADQRRACGLPALITIRRHRERELEPEPDRSLEAFFARRRAIWREQVNRILVPESEHADTNAPDARA